MTKILVLSDSHGNLQNMIWAVKKEKPDRIIHLGDCWGGCLSAFRTISGDSYG